jgi:hypothetical protein
MLEKFVKCMWGGGGGAFSQMRTFKIVMAPKFFILLQYANTNFVYCTVSFNMVCAEPPGNALLTKFFQASPVMGPSEKTTNY